jgi:hypothetical protein
MCELVATILAGGLAAGAQVAAGQSANAAAKANAESLRQQGNLEMAAASQKAEDIRYSGKRMLGETRAIQAKAGVDISGGSAADVGAESALNIEQDALRALYGGRVRKWQTDAQAKIVRAEGKNAMVMGYINAGTTLAKTAAKVPS